MRTKQKSEDDSATFCFVLTFIMILRRSTFFVGKLFSTHATVCTSLILQASGGAGLNSLLL